MHAAIRSYSGQGAKGLVDLLENSTAEVERIMRSIRGFVSYTLARTADGGISVSVFEDKAGADESVQKARDWVRENAAATGVGAPVVSEGSVILHLK